MSRKKSFVLPIVLLLFSVIFIIFISNYRRYISSHNLLLSKEKNLKIKFERESLSEILGNTSIKDMINGEIKEKSNMNTVISTEQISPKISGNSFVPFVENYSKYRFELNVLQQNKNSIFTSENNKLDFKKSFSIYNIYLNVFNSDDLLYEYKFIDKSNILNYLYDLQFIKFKNGIKDKIFKDDFFFNVDKMDYSFIYDEIFNDTSENYIRNDFRIYNRGNEIFVIYNQTFNNLLLNYFSTSDIDTSKIDFEKIGLSNLDSFLRENKIQKLNSDDFFKKYLLEYSRSILENGGKRNIFNFEIKDKLYFDFDEEVEVYSNFKVTTGDIKIVNKIPTIKGIFVNLSDTKFDFKLEGVYFSKKKNLNYRFNPVIPTITLKSIKLSKNYFVEFIEID